MTHLNAISCGQGAPSLFLIVLAGQKRIPADVVIVADTGWEDDMLWNTGERSTARQFFEQVTKPLAEECGLSAAFVRTLDKDGKPYEPIPVAMARKQKLAGSAEYTSTLYGLDIPMYGSNGGRLRQTCTSKWKIQGINQELRRRGADTTLTYLGLHLNEIRRLKPSEDVWRRNAWPLVDLMEAPDRKIAKIGLGQRWNREGVQAEMAKLAIPWLVTTQCDGCPHNDWERWKRHTPEKIDELAALEAEIGRGEFFFCEERVPLKEALLLKEAKAAGDPDQANFFNECGAYCNVG